jgi:hypothetical protein
MKGLRRCRVLLLIAALAVVPAIGQVEHVPMNHPVYEYLDRLGVKGVLPAFSASMVPLERSEVMALLDSARQAESSLGEVERRMLNKYLIEFAVDAGTRPDLDWVIIGSCPSSDGSFADAVSQKQKYLAAVVDSIATFYGELLASAEYRSWHGDSRGNVDATLKRIGGRFHGTVAGKVGYFLQSTNGVYTGNRALELADPHLATNMKLNERNDSKNFDETEAYLRLSFGWGGLQFGREYSALGVGYDDRLMLSDNAPVFDALEMDVHYKAFRFRFLHGSLLKDPASFPGLLETEPEAATKYVALHRFQVSVFQCLNLSANEMVIYQRFSPEFAYLNPVNFFKSAEHSLQDRDNALLMFDVEYFPIPGYKFYGSWLIDDVDFSRLGTGWWGNEFGWQGGAYVADVAGFKSCDLLLEYTRIEPYVYSNRTAGNDYSHKGVQLGHRLGPNSDELLGEVRLLLSERLRTRVHYAYGRHGDNVVVGDSVVYNVGGSLTQGHRGGDSETVRFLEGDRVTVHRVGARIDYEPIVDIFLACEVEWSSAVSAATAAARRDLALNMTLRLEY